MTILFNDKYADRFLRAFKQAQRIRRKSKKRNQMFTYTRIIYTYFLIIPLILLILLPTVSCAAADSISNEYNGIIEALKQEIRINSDDAGAHSTLGFACFRSGMYKEAIEAYKQTIRIDPDDVSAYLKLGYAYAKLDMYKEAIETHKQAIRIMPDNSIVHLSLGIDYTNSGMYKEALEAYKQTIRIDPDYTTAHFVLGFFYFVFKNDRDSALEQYKILKSLDSELANELFNYIYK